MLTDRVTEAAQEIMLNHLRSGDAVIDATVGNGYDTVMLAHCVGTCGTVFGFDIQSTALEAARLRIAAKTGHANASVTLIESCHSAMPGHIPDRFHGEISAVMFNLGYLPGSSRQIVTQSDSTRVALLHSIALLRPGGLLSVIAYPGHSEGIRELGAVQKFVHETSAGIFNWYEELRLTEQAPAPRLFLGQLRRHIA